MNSKELKKEVQEGIKEIVLARLQSINPNVKIMLLGIDKPLSVQDMMEEVEKDTELGKKIVKAQFEFIKMISRGEI
jgi:hypothetical protein